MTLPKVVNGVEGRPGIVVPGVRVASAAALRIFLKKGSRMLAGMDHPMDCVGGDEAEHSEQVRRARRG